MEETQPPAWLLQQAALSQSTRFISQSRQFALAGEGALTDNLAAYVAAQYALATFQSEDEPDPAASWKKLRALCHNVVALRRGDHLAQRLQLQRQRLPMPPAKTPAPIEP